MSLPRKLDEASSDQNDLDRQIKELKEGEQVLFFYDIKENRTQNIYDKLFKENIHPDTEVMLGFQPLLYACANGNFDIAEFLIMNGACVEVHYWVLLGIKFIKTCSFMVIHL